MSELIFVTEEGTLVVLDVKTLASQGHSIAQAVKEVAVSYDPEPVFRCKPNDLDRTYGKKYRRSLRK
ncbi:hypothetical protein C121_7 [Stenotrophomonas phage C121]|uniref:hypothetical protein n=1 Tax=Stenotrophomonas phage C121 TaxID=2914029 RepID=UPI0023291DEE|nr:hypothetical protein PP752_gp07 [Stenotrophomonas phage C121]UKL14740.1 hypothetical protein C121_7 [Stenotrophomonas phage C121]